MTATAPESGHNRLLCLLTLNPAPCPVSVPEAWSVGSLGASFPGSVSGRILTLKPTLKIGGTTWEVRSRLVSLRDTVDAGLNAAALPAGQADARSSASANIAPTSNPVCCVISTKQVGLVTLTSVRQSPMTSNPTTSRPSAQSAGPSAAAI